METITLNTIIETHAQILRQITALIPLERWTHKPSSIDVSSHKSQYGSVNAHGEMLINKRFINTTAIEKLKETICHEFTHLIVGLKNNHNAKFKRVLNSLTYHINIDSNIAKQQGTQVVEATTFKWTVFAILKCGTEVKLGQAHRKTKTYTDYDIDNLPKGKGTMSIRDGEHIGKTIARFKFIAN